VWSDLKASLKQIPTNGITLRACERGEGPLVVLVHGWPESWYSWRHQIAALEAAGYRALAPDMRGYGGSDAPEEIEAYTMRTMVADVVGLIDAAGVDEAIVVGHDWGAMIAWHTALLAPERVAAVAAMSVPFTGRAPKPPLELWREIYRDRFFYQLYIEPPGRAEADFSADVETALYKIFCGGMSLKADAGPDAAMLDLIDMPKGFPDWFNAGDLAYMAEQFRRSGFRGPFNRYRAQNRDWHDLAELDGATIDQPSLFVVGSKDPVLRMVPGVDLLAVQEKKLTDRRGVHVIEGCGHWIQQQAPDEVNRYLLGFVDAVTGGK